MSSKKIKFSVLIPVYNVGKYLVECLESVLIQDFHDYEIVLINDGSTDSSGSICDEYASRYEFINVYHQKNKGLIVTRKNLMLEAQGEYCLFIDSDDLIKPSYFSTVNSIIEKQNCDVVMVWFEKYRDGQYIKVNENKFLKNNPIITDQNKHFLFEELLSFEINSICNKVFKRNLYDFSMNSESNTLPNMGEDLYQILPILYKASKIVYISESFYGYRINPESMTAKVKLSNFTDRIIVLERLWEYFQKIGLVDDMYLQKIYQLFVQRLVLRMIYKIGYSKNDVKFKYQFYKDIKKNSYFQNALLKVDFDRFSVFEKMIYRLFEKNFYTLLVFCCLIIYRIKNNNY